ncbi:MAG: glycosyl hydrolase family protein [Clostridia bacterium]|nr:glycosyl hydrolase family protein [Clostridia bacterium]
MKKFLYLLLGIVFIFLVCLIFCFPKNNLNIDKKEEIQIKTIDKLVNFSGHKLDFNQPMGIITYSELISITGKVARMAELNPADEEEWFEPYINLAKTEGWLNKEFSNINDFNSPLSKEEALTFFINFLENTGEDNYPKDMKFYRDNQLDANVVKAYSKGLMIFNKEKLSSFLTKGEAYEILDLIINPSKRKIPFHLSLKGEKLFEINNYTYPSGKFFSGEKISVSFDVNNITNFQQDVLLQAEFIDPLGKEYKIPSINKKINSEKTVKYNVEWEIPEDIVSGNYSIRLSLFNNTNVNDKENKAAYSEIINQLMIYNNQEDFKNINTEIWRLSEHKLGRTVFIKENASITNGFLNFKIPENSFESSELQSVNMMGYGSYEIKMKIPDAPGSITGFFMYKTPDYYHEIDIEIYNQKSGNYFLTTYADGDKQKEFFGVTPFDPTLDFNTYRFDYYPDKLDYYINDIFIVRFTEGYSKEEMYLMVNSWYPNWVKGGPAKEDKYFSADWIRY